jgi:hypothetical protein
MSFDQVDGLMDCRPLGLVLAEGHLQNNVGRVVGTLQFRRVNDVELVSGILDALAGTLGLLESDITKNVENLISNVFFVTKTSSSPMIT